MNLDKHFAFTKRTNWDVILQLKYIGWNTLALNHPCLLVFGYFDSGHIKRKWVVPYFGDCKNGDI